VATQQMNAGGNCTTTAVAQYDLKRSLPNHFQEAKHLALTRCGEFNLYGMIDAQITVVEDKLLAGKT